jgi:hypothetical protein
MAESLPAWELYPELFVRQLQEQAGSISQEP